MSSIRLFTDGDSGLEQSRRSTRERKQTQHFGYSGSDSQAQGLVSKRLSRSLSLWYWLLLDCPNLEVVTEQQLCRLLTEERNEQPCRQASSLSFRYLGLFNMNTFCRRHAGRLKARTSKQKKSEDLGFY